MSNVNSGLTFPYDCPGGTEIPDWAYANNAGGALIVGEVCVGFDTQSSLTGV